MPAFTITVSDQENALIEARREDMQRTFPGVSISKNDAVKNLILSDKKHEARLYDVMLHVITNDIAEALGSLGWDGDEIVTVLRGVYAAHPESRRLHLPLPVEAHDIER